MGRGQVSGGSWGKGWACWGGHGGRSPSPSFSARSGEAGDDKHLSWCLAVPTPVTPPLGAAVSERKALDGGGRISRVRVMTPLP